MCFASFALNKTLSYLLPNPIFAEMDDVMGDMILSKIDNERKYGTSQFIFNHNLIIPKIVDATLCNAQGQCTHFTRTNLLQKTHSGVYRVAPTN